MISTAEFRRPKTFAPPNRLACLTFAPVVALAFSVFVSAPAWATGSVLSGMFDGSEAAIEPLFASDCDDTPLGYVQSAFEVSKSGTYKFNDVFGELRSIGGLDITAFVYGGSFDASAPGQNLIATADADSASEVALSAGSSYVLVAQLACEPAKGAWAVAFVGPGAISSDDSVIVPAFSSGSVAEDGPTKNANCDDDWGPYPTHYQQSALFRVTRDGTYYFSTAGIDSLCLSIYSAPVDPAEPWVNKVGITYPYERGAYPTPQGIELKAGQDYYILVEGLGDYFFVLAPPATFRINHGLADSWYNPETPGQGFFLDVFEQLNQVFLGWFTYAIDPPNDDEYGHRWLTAFGGFLGSSANLAIEWTGGGGFDAAQPVPEQHVDGSIRLEFNDCTSGQITYSWDGDSSIAPTVSQVIPIRRNANDAVALCESLYAGPGIPGPL